jgi:hypothetical protein
MSDKKKKTEQNSVHTELKGLNLQINAFGEIQSNLEIERINRFLDKHLEDKKMPGDKNSVPASEEE